VKRKQAPSYAKLRAYYQYDPITGLFWHLRNTGRGRIGQQAAVRPRPDGYYSIAIDGIWYLAHHIAWYYIYADWPDEIDHQNRQRGDNRLDNLRVAQRFQNNGNSDGWSQAKRTHKLPRGVYHHIAKHRPYRAQIVAHKRQVHLGCFKTVADAQAAYRRAARKHFREFFK
jgi:hypothetical protein